MRHSMLRPNELYYAASDEEPRAISSVNDDIYAQLTMPTVERRMVPTTDGKEMLTWIAKPQNLIPHRKYPGLLYCQKLGPAGRASSGVIAGILLLWRRSRLCGDCAQPPGLPGFGTEWNRRFPETIRTEHARLPIGAVDHVKTEPWIDAAHIGATGASYGGFSVYWLPATTTTVSHALSHMPASSIWAQHLETEEMWFANWDMGGGAWNAPADTKDFRTTEHIGTRATPPHSAHLICRASPFRRQMGYSHYSLPR